MNYAQEYERYLSLAQSRLKRLCEQYLPENSTVAQAARYSLLAGGKRVRAILVLAACGLLGGDESKAADLAGAVEMLHCYSLIHDDLPCMDDDDTRRGRPSCHKAFGEATAMLAGDLLLTEAFEVVASADLSTTARVRAAKALSHGAGAYGMVYGQELDLYYEVHNPTEEQLRLVHRNKTGALINAAVQMGVAAADGSEEDANALEQYAYDLGLVFQIVDDVLDVTAAEETLGKPVGSDAENGKTTFVTLYGVEACQKLAQDMTERACQRLTGRYGQRAEFLCRMAQRLVERNH